MVSHCIFMLNIDLVTHHQISWVYSYGSAISSREQRQSADLPLTGSPSRSYVQVCSLSLLLWPFAVSDQVFSGPAIIWFMNLVNTQGFTQKGRSINELLSNLTTRPASLSVKQINQRAIHRLQLVMLKKLYPKTSQLVLSVDLPTRGTTWQLIKLVISTIAGPY